MTQHEFDAIVQDIRSGMTATDACKKRYYTLGAYYRYKKLHKIKVTKPCLYCGKETAANRTFCGEDCRVRAMRAKKGDGHERHGKVF